MVLASEPITSLEELQNICALGLSVWVADPTTETAHQLVNPRIYQGPMGKFLTTVESSHTYYLQWLGVDDPTFTSTPYNDDLRVFNDEQSAMTFILSVYYKRKGIQT